VWTPGIPKTVSTAYSSRGFTKFSPSVMPYCLYHLPVSSGPLSFLRLAPL
jgi:hypothetical protein